jgi:hypothetical protein
MKVGNGKVKVSIHPLNNILPPPNIKYRRGILVVVYTQRVENKSPCVQYF